MQKDPAALLQQSSQHQHRDTTQRFAKPCGDNINPSKHGNAIHSLNRDTSKSDASPKPNEGREQLLMHPRKTPFPSTKQNINMLKNWLLEYFAKTAFNNNEKFPPMFSPATHIHLKEEAVPKARHNSTPLPFHFKEPVKQALWEDVKRGIITPVLADMPTGVAQW